LIAIGTFPRIYRCRFVALFGRFERWDGLFVFLLLARRSLLLVGSRFGSGSIADDAAEIIIIKARRRAFRQALTVVVDVFPVILLLGSLSVIKKVSVVV
jgi:hypothetical protein